MVLGLARDVSEREEAEETIRNSERTLRSIMDNMADGFYRTDMEGRLTLCSPSAFRILGYPMEENLLGRDVGQTFYSNPADRDALLNELSQKGEVRSWPLLLKHKDGTETVIEKGGSITTSPYVWLRDKALKHMKGFAVEFGMTPSARGRIQILPEPTEHEGILRFLTKGSK